MEKCANLFTGTKHAALYSKYRFIPPNSIRDRIVSYIQDKISPPFSLALDVGCGSGQSTQFLAPYFSKVVGLDVSESQILEATKSNNTKNVSYSVGSSTAITADNSSAQLISASQSFHWFDLPAFYEESKRVLVPNGVVSMYWYTMPLPVYGNKSEALQNLITKLYTKDTIEYWHENRKLVDRGFNGLDFPFQDVVRENFVSDINLSLADFVGFVKTWSSWQLMMKAEPERAKELIVGCETEMSDIIGSGKSAEETQMSAHFKYYLIMGRK